MAMKVQVREELCVGCCACAKLCPAVFQMDGLVARPREPSVSPAAADLVEALVDVCPARAIVTE